jgi:phosphoenolpyruvate carboxykinase (GTP)
VGVVRRDPMAMRPFCGYNFADYWKHWLSLEARSEHLPRIFHVNWFRQGLSGEYLWPGFGDNLRVLRWIVERCEAQVGAQETPIGFVPRTQDIDLRGLDLDEDCLNALMSVDRGKWLGEMASVGAYLDEFGERLPPQLRDEHRAAIARLQRAG